MITLTFKCRILKQDLKSKTGKLKYQKKIIERKEINKLFYKNPKKVYRERKGKWNNPLDCSVAVVDWMKELESNYCLNDMQKPYEIDKMTIDKAINKLNPSKAPGRDIITEYWYKQLNFYR